jgi:hypothetical protein
VITVFSLPRRFVREEPPASKSRRISTYFSSFVIVSAWRNGTGADDCCVPLPNGIYSRGGCYCGHRLKISQNRDGLARKGNYVLLAHLHSLARDPPLARVEVELGPARAALLARTYEYKRC